MTETIERDEDGRLMCYNMAQNISLNKVSQNRFKEVVGTFKLNELMNNEILIQCQIGVIRTSQSWGNCLFIYL